MGLGCGVLHCCPEGAGEQGLGQTQYCSTRDQGLSCIDPYCKSMSHAMPAATPAPYQPFPWAIRADHWKLGLIPGRAHLLAEPLWYAVTHNG